jgi:hypothetical protein
LPLQEQPAALTSRVTSPQEGSNQLEAAGTPQPYPLRIEGTLAPSLSRWLWLVKWLLAIPHFVVLFFLWAAFVVMSIVAFFAILLTGRYPRGVFGFNVGVLRWTWRVVFYSYGALGTDRYPPFTLDEVVDYPAKLEVDYPEQLSRGLVLVKWWLLAIPHYIVVAILVGGTSGFLWWEESYWGPGLITVLVLIAAVALLFTTRYPRGIFDFVLGLDRWAFRVAAYAGLMTDRYPPFRLDQGEGDLAPAGAAEPVVAEPPAAVVPETALVSRWTAGRIVAIVAGSILALISLGLLAGGIGGIVVDQTQRNGDGFLMSPSQEFDTGTYALLSETLDVGAEVPQWVIDELIGTVRIESESEQSVFVGIAAETDADTYLGDVRRAVVTDVGSDPDYSVRRGGAPGSPPGTQTFWVASTTGAGEQVLDWEAEDGDWVIVAMNADGSAGVTAELRIGAEVDPLIWIALGVLLAGVLIGLGAAALIYVGSRRPRGVRAEAAPPAES